MTPRRTGRCRLMAHRYSYMLHTHTPHGLGDAQISAVYGAVYAAWKWKRVRRGTRRKFNAITNIYHLFISSRTLSPSRLHFILPIIAEVLQCVRMRWPLVTNNKKRACVNLTTLQSTYVWNIDIWILFGPMHYVFSRHVDFYYILFTFFSRALGRCQYIRLRFHQHLVGVQFGALALLERVCLVLI